MSKPDFEARAGAYLIRWGEPEFVSIELDLIRAERSGDLTGEVSVWITPEGLVQHIHTARLNLSSTQARATLAKYLMERSNGHRPDWQGAIEIACMQTIAAFRQGEPAILLRDAEEPPDVGHVLRPLALGRLPTIAFGDGGGGKSLLALGAALSIHTGQPIIGLEPSTTRRVAYLDWEMDAWEHRERMRALVGEPMPDLLYVPCRRPLVEEVDRLRRIVRQRNIGYLVVDSVALACDGPPEAAEVANRFFGALRQLERGALCIAHTTKADDGERPFGSTFWHNGARLTWYVKRQQDLGSAGMSIGLFNRKANTGPLHPPLGFTITFEPERTRIVPSDLRDVPELAAKLPIRYRLAQEMQAGARTMVDLATTLEVPMDTVKKTLGRHEGKQFTRVVGPDGITRWGLAA